MDIFELHTKPFSAVQHAAQNNFALQHEFSGMRKNEGTMCSYCKRIDFEGDRYSCTICSEYDLCPDCFCSDRFNGNHILKHPCVCITTPILEKEENLKFRDECALEKLVTKYQYKQHTNINCSQCRQPLIGVRIKCEGCYEFDLCYRCWKISSHNQHPMILYTSEIIDKIPFENIQIGKKLGGGAFGNVYKATIKPKSYLFACKVVESGQLASSEKMDLDSCMKSLIREMNAHMEIRSAFICKMFGYSIDMNPNGFRMCVLMEFMDKGTLTDLIKDETEGNLLIPYLRKIKILGDIAGALRDIHAKKFIHADLKPDNVLLTNDYSAKVSDFGIIKNRNVHEINDIGSVQYMPPEFHTGHYDNTVDLFSFGLVMYHFLVGRSHKIYTDGRPILNHTHSIRVPLFQKLIQTSTSLYPQQRHNALYYFTRLRNLTDAFSSVLRNHNQLEKYQSKGPEEKDEIFLSYYDECMSIALNKNKLQASLYQNGLSENDIHKPAMEKFLNMTAKALNDIEDNKAKSQMKNESTTCALL